ncbi:MAG TPA: hypothetical protein DIU00_22025 [Phycisphaerales bacterium]|nr:hypothetical protein [Phycisphaerales bacterium]
MRSRFLHRAVLGILLICWFPVCLATEISNPNESSKYLDAVREFADNVLKYGRDTYGPKHTPLFVDGLNIHTHEPVKWIAPNGDRWILSNLASQQNLFRTLDGLSTITGDSKYRQAAMETIAYAFENLRSPNRLLMWGGAQAYDVSSDKPCGRYIHVFKNHYPYYQLMWEVNPEATRHLIESLWSAHILNWENLDMNRGVRYRSLSSPVENPWDHEYRGRPGSFQGKGIAMVTTSSDLFYSGSMLFKLSGNKKPFIWSKRLANRYAETRNLHTGISTYAYNIGKDYAVAYQFGDDFNDCVAANLPLFPGHGGTGSSVNRQCGLGLHMVTPGISYNIVLGPRICALLLGTMLGEEGEYFKRWALDEMTAWGNVAYRKSANCWVPMFTDGTSIEGYTLKKGGYFGPKGTVIESIPAIPMDFWGYALAYRVTGDEFMLEMARNIAQGLGLGDIDYSLDGKSQLNTQTDSWQPYTLLGFLELYKKKPE